MASPSFLQGGVVSVHPTSFGGGGRMSKPAAPLTVLWSDGTAPTCS